MTGDHLRRRLVVLLAALLLVGLGACSDDDDDGDGDGGTEQPSGDGGDDQDDRDDGDGDDDADGPAVDEREPVELPPADQPFADAMADGMSDDFYTREQATCIATNVVAAVGSERLAASGLTPEEFGDQAVANLGLDLDRSAAEAVYDALAGCGEDYRERLLDDMVDSLDDPDPVRACLADVYTPEVVRDLMVDRLQAAPGAELEMSDELTAAAEACVADVGG